MNLFVMLVALVIIYFIVKIAKNLWDKSDVREKKHQLNVEMEMAKDVPNITKTSVNKNRKTVKEFTEL